jgi:RNA polymerase sigma-70 factor (ECF subfamily)
MTQSFAGFERLWLGQLSRVARDAETRGNRARTPRPLEPMPMERDNPADIMPSGPVEARYLAFLETIAQLRPSLHRYCARMTGSALDGEDVVQEALVQAYRKLESFDDTRPLKPWLFRIAHNRCIDFLRRRGIREETEAAVAVPDAVPPVDPIGPALGKAVERLVLTLPPKERACVLLKDVFDYSLEEIAELVDSTLGGVKAALNRGRSKLTAVRESPPAPRARSAELSRLLTLYVERFNQRDWDGLRELITADATLRVADRFAGRTGDSPYFGRYARLTVPWRLAVGEIDGEPVVIVLGQDGAEWMPEAVVRLDVENGRITRIADYCHCPWITKGADSLVVAPSS